MHSNRRNIESASPLNMSPTHQPAVLLSPLLLSSLSSLSSSPPSLLSSSLRTSIPAVLLSPLLLSSQSFTLSSSPPFLLSSSLHSSLPSSLSSSLTSSLSYSLTSSLSSLSPLCPAISPLSQFAISFLSNPLSLMFSNWISGSAAEFAEKFIQLFTSCKFTPHSHLHKLELGSEKTDTECWQQFFLSACLIDAVHLVPHREGQPWYSDNDFLYSYGRANCACQVSCE